MLSIPQSTTLRVPLQAYLSSDHVSAATGKTIAVTISKNGAAYGNPNAGATNATEIANGSYYVDLGTADTGTTGPLFIRGAVANIDDVIAIYNVVKATNGGWTALPDTAATTNASLLTSGTGTDQLSVTSGRIDLGKALGTAVTLDSNNVLNVSTKYVGGTLQTARDIGLNVLLSSGTGTGQISLSSGLVSLSASQTFNVTGNITGNLSGSVGSVTGAVGSVTGSVGSVTGAVGSVTGNVGGNVTGTVASVVAAVTVDGTSPLTEAYAAAGTPLTLAKGLYGINQFLGQHSTASTTWSVQKRDGSTVAKTYTLDSATVPTSITETT